MKRSLLQLLLLTPAWASSLLPRQSGCEATEYTSPIGLTFTTKCKTNAQGNDIRDHDSSSLNDCMDACAESWSDTVAACRAITYNTEEKHCWQKDGNTTTADYKSSNVSISAIADAKQFDYDPSKDICPGANGTIRTDENGYTYRVLCETWWDGDSFDPVVFEEYQPFHANDLGECLDYCSSHSPLCYGVRYTDDPGLSYRNCYAKKANGTTPATKLKPNKVHTVALALLNVNSTCTSSSYTSRNGAVLEPKCDQTADGPTLKDIHTDNFEQCMDSCSSYKDPQDAGNRKCTGVVYQPNAEDGFLNCYLKYALSNVTAKAEWHVATVSSQSPDNKDDGDSNTAVIAGAVAGSVGGVALLAGLVFWYRRSMKKARESHGSKDMAESQPFAPNGVESPPPGYNSHVATPAPFAAAPGRTPQPLAELDGRIASGGSAMRHELQ